jgi:hypothetical protein
MNDIGDDRLGKALREAMNQVGAKGTAHQRLLAQLKELDAARQAGGKVPPEVLERTEKAILQAPGLLRPTEKGSGLIKGGAEEEKANRKRGPSPLAELRQVLVDLKTLRS